jgi:hypothetical protein
VGRFFVFVYFAKATIFRSKCLVNFKINLVHCVTIKIISAVENVRN